MSRRVLTANHIIKHLEALEREYRLPIHLISEEMIQSWGGRAAFIVSMVDELPKREKTRKLKARIRSFLAETNKELLRCYAALGRHS